MRELLILVLLAAGLTYALANGAGYGFGLHLNFSFNLWHAFSSAVAPNRQLPMFLGVYG